MIFRDLARCQPFKLHKNSRFKMVSALSKALLAQIELSTNFPQKAANYAKFFIENHHVGFLNDQIKHDLATRGLVDETGDGVRLKDMSSEERSRVFAEMLSELRKEDKYKTLRGWRNELYTLWVNGRTKALMTFERSAAALFGFTTYGVHINGYVNRPEGPAMWIGRRSPTKSTYPNMLDQVVAGGLTSGLSVLECCKKEAGEEASLPDHVTDRLKPVGIVNCFYEDARGVCPESEYVLDLELPADFSPTCQDGEMAAFSLMTYPEVLERVGAGEFKLNCGVICIDFMIRHGVITPDTEPYYNQLYAGIHIKLPQD